MMYDELVKELRKMQSVEYCVITSIESFPAIKIVDEAADAIEELQKQLQKSEADNVNLTGWLAEEHANNCPHYIHNVHDRGDDSLCDVLMTEPPKLTYKELLRAAKKMHTWIFLNTGDEQKAYDECGLSDEMNAALGYRGRLEIKVDPCADCVHYPPSSTDGKPCCACDPANPLTNCHEAKGET